MTRLRDDFERVGKGNDFDHLKDFLTGEAAAPSDREVAAARGRPKGPSRSPSIDSAAVSARASCPRLRESRRPKTPTRNCDTSSK